MVSPLFVMEGIPLESMPMRDKGRAMGVKAFLVPKKELILAGLSGLLLFFSFPKYGNGIVAWAALVPLFFALKGVTPRAGFRIGFLAGFIAHIGIFHWIVYVVVQYGYLPVYVAVAAMLLLVAYLSLYTACFAMGVVFLGGKGIPLFLSAPLLWTVLEFLRSQLLTGFPWENLAYSQYLYTSVIQISDITGIYGVTFAIVLINAVMYDLLSSRSQGRRLLIGVVFAGVAIAAILLYGHIRLAEIDGLLKRAPRFPVALIQGNIDQSIKWDSLYQSQTIDIYSSLSRQSIPSGNGLIVWPETAAPFHFQRPGPLREAVVETARTSGSAILFGSPSYEEEDGNIHYMNSAFLLGPDGALNGRYDKVHLVPYGEYVPLRRLFPFIGKLVVGVGDFKQGKGFHPLTVAGRRLGVLICYEGIFPEGARDYKRQKAEILVNITNDAWFGRTSAPYQHLSMTVFRAIENRLSLVRAANTGISAMIDPNGRIVSRTGLFERKILTGDVKIIDVNTCYAAYGDAFVYLCAIVLLVITISTTQRRKRHAGRNSGSTARSEEAN
jgi:apolipoprotein N-acyltransferase